MINLLQYYENDDRKQHVNTIVTIKAIAVVTKAIVKAIVKTVVKAIVVTFPCNLCDIFFQCQKNDETNPI